MHGPCVAGVVERAAVRGQGHAEGRRQGGLDQRQALRQGGKQTTQTLYIFTYLFLDLQELFADFLQT